MGPWQDVSGIKMEKTTQNWMLRDVVTACFPLAVSGVSVSTLLTSNTFSFQLSESHDYINNTSPGQSVVSSSLYLSVTPRVII